MRLTLSTAALLLIASPTRPADDLSAVADYLEGMEPYQPAKMTRLIATENAFDHSRDYVTPIPRSKTEEKYRVNGGMVGVEGVKSYLFRNAISKEAETWIGFTDVAVGNGRDWQQVYNYKVTFPNKSRFVDVLTYDGKVFEARQREKIDGTWQYKTIFQDKAARPKGYTGLNQSCISCHKNAGGDGHADAPYDGPLPPGGDQTFSVGLRWLEGK